MQNISDLDVMATYKIPIDILKRFDQHGVPAADGGVENARHVMMHPSRLALHPVTVARKHLTLMDAFINNAV